MKANEIREQINAKIIQAIKNDLPPWRHPWQKVMSGSPCNPQKRRYTGINPLILMISSAQFDYVSKYWATYKTWARLGLSVKKGEKATWITFFSLIPKKDSVTKQPVIVNGKESKIPLLRQYAVFNADQLARETDTEHVLNRFVLSEDTAATPDFGPLSALVAATGINIVHRGEKACFNRNSKRITMPKKSIFVSDAHYYETLLHEIMHWAEDEVGDRKDHYGFSELVAEIGACYLMTEMRVPMHTEMLQSSYSYLKGWLKSMESDPKYIFDAATRASKLVDYLLALVGEEALEPEYEEAA